MAKWLVIIENQVSDLGSQQVWLNVTFSVIIPLLTIHTFSGIIPLISRCGRFVNP
jgi:hypothetical protein